MGNPIAAAIVDRAAALAGDRGGLVPAAAALEAAGCRYQWARTLVFIGGAERARGESVLAAMGATVYGLASRMRLNGVWVARRTRVNPASRSTMPSWRSPACAPSPRPTSCASDPGVQITVDRP